MKIKSLFFICFFLFGAALTSNAQIGPWPACTTSHTNSVLSTSPVSVLTCQNQTIAAATVAHCNAIGSYGYRFVISNGGYSKSYVTHTPYWSGTCHDLKCGFNQVTVYYRSSPGGPWSQYALGGITLTDCDI